LLGRTFASLTMDLLGKSAKRKLVSVMNEGAASGPSDWARKMLEKQGWAAGKGLGRNEDGRTEHVRIKKKDDTAAIG
jgi:Pin2-interacting protein X1